MLRHCGQALLSLCQTVRHICGVGLTTLVLTALIAAGAAWRLAQGPVDLGFALDRIESALNNGHGPARIRIGDASIAWDGFRRGLNRPVVLRIGDLVIEDPGGGRIHVPVAEATVSVRGLLTGRIIPRTISLQGAMLLLIRGGDGTIGFALNDTAAVPPDGTPDSTPGPSALNGLLAVLAAPASSDTDMRYEALSQLASVTIGVTALRVEDRRLGVAWRADQAEVRLFRHPGGGVDGRATAMMVLGDQRPALRAVFVLAPGGRAAHVTADLSKVTPKALAGLAPALAPLAALDAPLTVEGSADLAPDPGVERFHLSARAGQGTIAAGGGQVTLNRAEAVIDGTPDDAALKDVTIELRPSPSGPVTTLRGSGQILRAAGRLGAALHLTLDRAAFASLPGLWPPDIARPARQWMTQNITGGTARDGVADLVLDMAEDGSDLTLSKAVAGLEGDDLTATWLPNVPPVEHARAHLALIDPDRAEIDVTSGRQRVKNGDPIAILNSHITLTGLSKNHQVAVIACDAAGSIPAAISLLKEPRLRLLDRHPMELGNPAGDVRMSLHLTVPLELSLTFDDVTFHGTGTLSKAHLSGIAAGRDMDDGALSLDVDANRLTLKGTAKLAGIPASIDGTMDFRSGGPAQVTRRFAVTAKPSVQALTNAGLDTAGVLTGDVGLAAVLSERRGGDNDVTIDADLTGATAAVAPLAWRKPAGTTARATARLRLAKDRLTGIEAIAVSGDRLDLRGSASLTNGHLDSLRVERALLGRTDIAGTVRLPPNGPIVIEAAGPSLDLATKIEEPAPKRPPGTRAPPDPAISLRGRFDRVFVAHGQTAESVAVSADYDGRRFQDLTAAGAIMGGKPFSIRIAGGPGGRRLTVAAQDAGRLLLGLDVTPSIQGGTLAASGTFDDRGPDRPLSGTLEMTDFRVTKAAALGKLLQALTLYGLVDALGGPGLSFSRLTAPFRLTNDAVFLDDARAFSPSLGVTVKGRIGRTDDRLTLEGTVVPAYVFNSLLGRIPLIGRLFTAEKGGGLIAMTYALHGRAADPDVTANPLSALTPGILRGMFGLFDRSPVDQSPGGSDPPGP